MVYCRADLITAYRGIEVNPSIFSLRITSQRQGNALIPKIFSSEELDRARNFYATECERDVRNKAIVLSLIELGLRTSEVAGMMLDDIHWKSGYLTVRSSKTHSERVLPLPDELGKSYEKYILKYRPKSKSNQLFLRTGRNSGQAITTEQVRRIVRYMMNKTGLSSFWVGAHAFRRTLGSRLFNACEKCFCSGCEIWHTLQYKRHSSFSEEGTCRSGKLCPGR